MVLRAAVMTALLVTSILLRWTSTDVLFARMVQAFYVVAGVSYLSILAGAIGLRRAGLRGVRVVAYAQLVIDSTIATVIVALTGGVESVFVFVISLNILTAAAVLQKKGATALAAVAAALYSLLFAGEVNGWLVSFGLERRANFTEAFQPFLTNLASFVLVAALAGFLTDQLRRTRESLDVARAEIERLEELYHAVLESLPSGVVTVDEEGRIVYLNQAGADILGAMSMRLVGRALAAAVPPLAAAAAEGSNRFERAALIEGRERTIGGSVARLTGLEGLAGNVIVFQDLTELRKLQQDVAQAERLAELGRFAAGLAHEIRNPLAAMIGCLQLLRSDEALTSRVAGDSARMLGIVHREAERLSTLVTEFLTYARPSPPSLQETQLLALARETVATMKAGFAAGVRIDVEGSDQPAQCDPQQLRQVVWNLVGNAVDALGPRGRAAGIVRVTVAAEPEHMLLVVDDNGPGVPAELRRKIFEPFFTTRADGTGLGLATVHQTVLQHAGTIDVASAPLGGARFVVRLPRPHIGLVDA